MDTQPRRILLTGATGYIGRAVAARLVANGHHVIAMTRGKPPADSADWENLQVDLGRTGDLERQLGDRDIDAVISCIASRNGEPGDAWRVEYDANLALLATALSRGASQFILLSAICVQRPRLAFQHAKLAFEAKLQQADIDHTIVRPTAFFKSLSGQVDRVKRGKPFLIFGNGELTACKPIGNDDLATYLVDCLHDPERRNCILPIGGPGAAITPREQGELLFELAGVAPRFRSVPPKLFTAAAAILSPIGRLIPGIAAKAEFARIAHYYATESMLLWNPVRERYDADATPAFGTMTLREHYQNVLRDGVVGHEAGEHKLFRD
ncbi:MAG: NAD(P)H-binding protein [Pseudomonadota bacterium]